MDKFWKKFNETMDGLGDAINEEVADMESRTGGTGVSIANSNGKVVITGNIKSLTVNGRKIDLTGKNDGSN